MQENYDKLQKIYNEQIQRRNIRSSRRVQRKRLHYAGKLFKKIHKESRETESIESVLLYDKAFRVFKNIENLIEEKSEDELISFKATTTALIFAKGLIKMAQAFDIRTATAIVNVYDGSAENLDAFIDAVTLLNQLTPEAQKTIMCKFIKTRLTAKARVGMNAQLNTAEALIADVKLRCEIKVTPENLLAKMRSMKTKGSNEVFQQELETLSNKLKASYLEQMIPEPVAARMATKAGVDTLINQASSLEEKLILKTGSFSSIQEAIQKVNECVQTNENRQVLHFNKNGNHTNNRWRNVPTRNNRGNHVRQNNRGRSQNFYPQQNQRTFY